jgi:hypothetical protein
MSRVKEAYYRDKSSKIIPRPMAHHQEDGDGAPLSVHVMWSAAGVLNSEIKSTMMLQREEHGWCAS